MKRSLSSPRYSGRSDALLGRPPFKELEFAHAPSGGGSVRDAPESACRSKFGQPLDEDRAELGVVELRGGDIDDVAIEKNEAVIVVGGQNALEAGTAKGSMEVAGRDGAHAAEVGVIAEAALDVTHGRPLGPEPGLEGDADDVVDDGVSHNIMPVSLGMGDGLSLTPGDLPGFRPGRPGPGWNNH